jgi:hypothetical protein
MGGIGSGRKKLPKRLFKDAIQNIDDNEIFDSLKHWAKGKEVICPYCNRQTGAYTADTVALQAAIELLNRKRGKVPQSVQLDITETIHLNADQIDQVIKNHLPQIVEIYRTDIAGLLGPVIEGETKETI